MPISRMAWMASGRTEVATVPADWTSAAPPARLRRSPSAICDLALLWVHKNSTLMAPAWPVKGLTSEKSMLG